MTAETVNQFFSFLYSGTLGEIVFWWRIAAGIITSALIGIIVVILTAGVALIARLLGLRAGIER